MKLATVIQETFNLFHECIPLHDTKIEQMGNYISFQNMKKIDTCHKELDFSILVAGRSFKNNVDNILVTCDSFLEKIRANRVNPISLKSLMVSKDLRLVSIKDGLYVYELHFFIRIQV